MIRYEVTPINFSGTIKLISALDGNVTNLATENDPRVGSGLHGRVLKVIQLQGEGDYGLVTQQTQNSGLTSACAMCNQIATEAQVDSKCTIQELSVQVEYQFSAEPGVKIRLDKFIAVVTSLDGEAAEISVRAKNEVFKSKEIGFEEIKQAQQRYLAEFWERTDVVIKGDPAIQQGIRFNLFHLLQSAGTEKLILPLKV